MDKQTFTFEEIFKQNERRIHYHLHKLNIRDPHREFYQEGAIAMWNAYENYQPDKGPLNTYFNFIIRRRLIDLIRKESKRQEKEILAPKDEEAAFENSVYQTNESSSTHVDNFKDIIEDEQIWQHVMELLSGKQWKWVEGYIIADKSLKEIAEQEGVSVEAVKSWGKEARKKMRNAEFIRSLEGEFP
ncbi:sigma-70 family RNA polymerase sigma factor [Oceanobacillus saliphilus]|uniref:sigma-70 family RNA polymerase sigma factor n=1 Tax=Oceanobacillus saliphilus TaxID=2925834 RepID=UPI00201DB770|nr:sigma-70 family RNA polymerase sigma factor [Oceanobacillus saliphilus]